MTSKEGYEWTAHMLNINAGHKELLSKCPALEGYAPLVKYTRKYQTENLDLKDAKE
jgi:hypothetical protein